MLSLCKKFESNKINKKKKRSELQKIYQFGGKNVEAKHYLRG